MVTATVSEAIGGRGWLGGGGLSARRRQGRLGSRIGFTSPGRATGSSQGRAAPERNSRCGRSPRASWPARAPARPRGPFASETCGSSASSSAPICCWRRNEGLLLVDQHAAHERVLYERLRAAWLAGGVERQGLLVPTTVELDAAALTALDEHGEVIEALGFEVESLRRAHPGDSRGAGPARRARSRRSAPGSGGRASQRRSAGSRDAARHADPRGRRSSLRQHGLSLGAKGGRGPGPAGAASAARIRGCDSLGSQLSPRTPRRRSHHAERDRAPLRTKLGQVAKVCQWERPGRTARDRRW